MIYNKNKPMFIYIDDDGVNSFNTLYENVLKPRGIKGGLAIISDTISNEYFTYLTHEEILNYQSLGWEILNHSCDGETLTSDNIDTKLTYATRRFKELGYLNKHNILVYPNGNVSSDSQRIISSVKKYFDYGLNVAIENNYQMTLPIDVDKRFNMGRLFIDKNMSDDAKGFVQSCIDSAIKNKSVLIISTHSYSCDEEYLASIIDYIQSQGYDFTPLNEAFNIIEDANNSLNDVNEISLDLSVHRIVNVHCVQNDENSRKLIITLTNNGKFYSVPEDINVKYKLCKADNTYIYNDVDLILSDGRIYIDLTAQCLSCVGIAHSELQLIKPSTVNDEGQIISSMPFNVIVKESVISNNSIESTNEFQSLNKILLDNENHFSKLSELEETVSANEEVRIASEDTRIRNENNRNDAEGLRQINTANAITNTNTATQNAKDATMNAVNATNDATDATNKALETIGTANDTIETMKSLMKDDNLVHSSDLGIAGGVATLDENGNIPASQLPSFVDEYIEGVAVNVATDEETGLKSATGFIKTGDTEECIPISEKIYVDINENISYRWSGSIFVCIGGSLTIGTSSATAFSGSRGLALEERVSDIEKYHNNIPASDIKFDNADTTILSANVQDAIAELTSEATHTKAGLLSAEDKKRIDNYADVQVIDIILYASNWTGLEAPYSQIVTVDGISTYNNCSVEMPTTATADELYAMTGASVHYDESIGFTFTVDEKPTIDIPIQLCVGTSMNITEVPKYIGESPVLGVKGDNETDYRNGYVNITAENIGLGNVPNVTTNDQTPTYEETSTLSSLTSGEKLSVALGKIAKAVNGFMAHYATRATASIQGHVKLSDSSAVTGSTGLALPATEKNASISGTLANQIENRLLLTGGTLSGDLSIIRSNGTEAKTQYANTYQSGNCTVSSTGKFGLYSNTNSKWVVYGDTDGTVYVDGVKASNFTKRGTIDSLCEWHSATAGSTYTVSLGDISKYKYILIVGRYGDPVRCSHFVPTTFINLVCKHYQLGYTDGSSNMNMGEVTFSGGWTNMSVTFKALMAYAPIRIVGVY